MNKIFIVNLKMNLTYKDASCYKRIVDESNINNLIIAPSNIYLETMKSNKYELCAQNGHYLDYGAFTGEVSFKQLHSINVKYSLIGHYERRKLFNENIKDIRLKLLSCINNEIIPILCIGEDKKEKENKVAIKKVIEELKTILKGISLDKLIIVYEPFWSIGTLSYPEYKDIELMHERIKNIASEHTKNVYVLYGGSVDKNNIKEILNINNVDGVLIGNSGINPHNLIEMYNIVK